MSEERPQIQVSQRTISPAIALVVLLALICSIAYGFYQHGMAKQLAAQNDQINTALKDTHSQIEALNARLNSLTVPVQAKPLPRAASSSQARSLKPTASRHRQADDPRWKQFQSRLDQQGQDIQSTRLDLASARTELSGSIARTHGELVALRNKGERNYYEFDINKSKEFHREGPVGVRLRKANTKHKYADLDLQVEDADLSQKHVNLYQPVIFYPADSRQPLELVINAISKDHIHGYLSTPKYTAAELAAMAPADNASNSASGNDSSGSAATQSASSTPDTTTVHRQRLEPPR
ncbi:MAG TPA: hypothetical protein VEG30_12565 [Terriglobales bacterium]|nr:hypothetical protein [Terriglobales bacterium]